MGQRMMNSNTSSESGTVLLAAIVAVMMVLGFGLVMMTTVTSASKEMNEARTQMNCLYLAETGLQAALLNLSGGGTGVLGTETAPVDFAQGRYWVTTVNNGDLTHTITARGVSGGRTRTIQAIVEETGHVFHHAVFAGNSGNDPSYSLDFAGNGGQADTIVGDIYSGGDIEVTQNATVNGHARASGTITGTPGTDGTSQPIPDLAAMAYETNHDVNVGAEFAANEYYTYDDAGGDAYQIPAGFEAHIFRKNPSDRSGAWGPTTKDDYFLEDPYEPPDKDVTQDGTDCYKQSLINSNGRVFFIDGNLWLHNYPTFSFMLTSTTGEPVRATFVVKGNIYFGDNVYYNDKTTDGIAFIALKDAAVPDSGNIYFGDINAGTLEHMESFMYAENNFHDNNLSATGSSNVEVIGTMSAGNQVAITRTYGAQHSQLVVVLDERLKNGQLVMPGVPASTVQKLRYSIVAWMEVTAP